MAITITNRGTAVKSTSGTTHTMSPSGNFAAGSMAVIAVTVDNSGTNGAAHGTFTVTDSLGNTWTRRTTANYDPGAANEGLDHGEWTTSMDGGTLTTGTVITMTVGTAASAWASALVEVVRTSASYTLAYSASGVGTGSNSAAPSVTTSSITSGHALICSCGIEAGLNGELNPPTYTFDSDSSNGSWGTGQSNNTTQSGTSGQSICMQTKVVTGTGTQTWNLTFDDGAADQQMSWVSISEALTPSSSKRLGLLGVG